jgi:hypothetical protein
MVYVVPVPALPASTLFTSGICKVYPFVKFMNSSQCFTSSRLPCLNPAVRHPRRPRKHAAPFSGRAVTRRWNRRVCRSRRHALGSPGRRWDVAGRGRGVTRRDLGVARRRVCRGIPRSSWLHAEALGWRDESAWSAHSRHYRQIIYRHYVECHTNALSISVCDYYSL